MSATITREPVSPPRLPPPGRSPNWAVLALAMVAGLALLLTAGDLVPSFRNPFVNEDVDRSQPALLRALEDLSEYRASSAHFEIVLDVEEDARYIPSFLKGERTVFVAAGSVDAYVDFSALSPEAIQVSGNRRAVRISLPRAQLSEARVDLTRSYVAVRDRGLLDRLESVFSDNPTGEREFYLLAQGKLTRAAGESGVVDAAERNTEAMLDRLLRSLGFSEVAVDFDLKPRQA